MAFKEETTSQNAAEKFYARMSANEINGIQQKVKDILTPESAKMTPSKFDANMFSAVKAAQEKLGVKADGMWGKGTEAAYQDYMNTYAKIVIPVKSAKEKGFKNIKEYGASVNEQGTKKTEQGEEDYLKKIKIENKTAKQIKTPPEYEDPAKKLEELGFKMGEYPEGETGKKKEKPKPKTKKNED